MRNCDKYVNKLSDLNFDFTPGNVTKQTGFGAFTSILSV